MKNKKLDPVIRFIEDVKGELEGREFTVFMEVLKGARDDWCVLKNRRVSIIMRELSKRFPNRFPKR